MKTFFLKFIIFTILSICFVKPTCSQSQESDFSFHPYHVNYWITGSIIAVGAVANYNGVNISSDRPEISDDELRGLNENVINRFDRQAFNQDITQKSFYTSLSDNLLGVIMVLPSILLFDKNIRHDWIDVLLMYAETMTITTNIYEYSFFGPNFQSRFRPIVYYEALPKDQRIQGFNRSSLFSGHTASTAAATFFMAKVYSDYHPELEGYKYLLYVAASIPPLIDGYARVRGLFHFPSDVMVGLGVGALCGILIPEFHRINDKNITLGVYSSSEATGIAMKWQTNILK